MQHTVNTNVTTNPPNQSIYTNNKVKDLPNYNYLVWQCRRGMLELDRVLLNFLHTNYMFLPKAQQKSFQQLLSCSDADLFDWLFTEKLPTDLIFKNLILLFKQKM